MNMLIEWYRLARMAMIAAPVIGMRKAWQLTWTIATMPTDVRARVYAALTR